MNTKQHEADGRFKEYLQRTALLLGDSAVERLRRTTVLVAGLGGTGGALAVTLARMGVGNFIIADPGTFEAPDVNRQFAAEVSTIGRNKAEVYAELLSRLVPGTAVEWYGEGIQPDNVAGLVSRADLVCDNLDITVPMELRARLLQLTREAGRYSMSCPILGFGALLAVAAPQGAPMELFLSRLARVTMTSRLPEGLRELFAPEHLERLQRYLPSGSLPSMAISPLVSAAVSATEATLVLLEDLIEPWRPPISLPDVLVVDLFRMKHVITNVNCL